MFNEEQQKAIETIKGQLILVACPGSGKTTTLLGRIHEMIQQGVPAENILMVTFTTAAAFLFGFHEGITFIFRVLF